MTTYAPAAGVLAEEIDGRMLLIDGRTSELVTLNPVGTLIWDALGTGRSTLPSLVEALAVAYGDVPGEQLSDDIEAFLASLVEAGLVVAA